MRFFKCVLLLLGLVLTVPFAGAQNTGKIAGLVIDESTGDPLPGVSIVIQELTGVGGATNTDGEYFILQVPPGIYTVVASFIGFRRVTTEQVTVRSDLTTRLNFNLLEQVIEGEELIVMADNSIVQHDVTATRRSTTREELRITPGMEQALDVFKVQAGTVVDAAPQTLSLGEGQTLQVRDESVKNVHVRGGRGGEILFMVDGMPVTHPLYGGRSVLELGVNDVEQVELLTGAFNAEYGQAQSGVVNITTRSGGESYEGGLEYRTDEVPAIGESYSTQYASYYFGGPVPGIRRKDQLNLFVSGSMNLTDTPYDNGRQRGDFGVFGIDVPERQDNSLNLNTKLSWKVNRAIRTALSFNRTQKQWSSFNWLWRNHPNHLAIQERTNTYVGLLVNHTLSPRTFYSLRAGLMQVAYDASLDARTPASFWSFYPDSTSYADGHPESWETWSARGDRTAPYRLESEIAPPTIDPVTGFFNADGYENIWRNDDTRTFTIKGDLTSQLHRRHLLKTGFELQIHQIQYIDIQDGGVTLSPWGRYLYRGEGPENLTTPPGPFPEFGQNRWVFDAKPTTLGAFIQDKFELESLIINAGIRVDAFNPGNSVFDSNWQTQWERATGLDADWPNWRAAISPRFGISFPINPETVIFFSYGHFSQLPEMQFYYRDPYTGGLTGNPHLDFEQTILYEFGFTRALAENWSMDIKSYAKDIARQVGTLQLASAFGFPVALYDNSGYARARGLEFELSKRYSRFTAGSVTYTVQWATGFSSSAFDQYVRSVTDFPHPIRERRLPWDTRHQLVAQATLSAPPGQNPEIFGIRLPSRWDITILSRLSSGQPYTPGTTDPAEQQKLENTATGPPVYSTDIKIRKGFQIGSAEISLFTDLFNVFNQHNVQIQFGFNNWTGQPFRYGDVFQNSSRGLDYYDMVRLRDPRQFSTGRYIKFGLLLSR